MTSKTKAAANGTTDNTIQVEKPTIRFVPLKQRQLEAWTVAFQDEGGHEAMGRHIIAGATVRALVTAGILLEPKFEDHDAVYDADPYLVTEIYHAFDEIYIEATTIPKV